MGRKKIPEGERSEPAPQRTAVTPHGQGAKTGVINVFEERIRFPNAGGTNGGIGNSLKRQVCGSGDLEAVSVISRPGGAQDSRMD